MLPDKKRDDRSEDADEKQSSGDKKQTATGLPAEFKNNLVAVRLALKKIKKTKR